MCGIAGFIDPQADASRGEDLIRDMAACISHRGPDANSIYHEDDCYLGHNRLSIIDLSDEANQPMHYGKLVIVFNGEIYNYPEVKDRLIKAGLKFHTQSDTEVILAAYLHWGEDCVREFVGMWALAIWDKEKKSLFASRDRFGIKPFYYIYDGKRFFFSSEYKPLKKSPLFSNGINLQQVSRGLQMGWISYADETYFEKIKALPAAHNLTFANGKLTVSRYWDIDTSKKTELGFEEKKQRFYDLFADSIRLHLRSDVPVASCLSGGLDSSAIVSMVQHLNPGMPYQSFSIYYEGKDDVDERPFIYEVIKKYPEIQPFYFSPSDEEVEGAFHHALYHADVPVTGSSFLSQYFLMKLIARNKIKVVLDGQGSDEYLCGYMHTFYRVIADLINSFHFGKAAGLSREVSSMPGKSFFNVLGKSIMSSLYYEQKLYETEYRHYYPFLSRSGKKTPFKLEHKPGNRTDQFLYHLLFNTSLPSLLHYEDRNSMAFSIESRVPFLDHRLVEFAFTLNTDDKVRGIETKYILRRSLENILPEAIVNRKDKKGFVTPGENKWLRGSLRFLLDIDPSIMPFLDRSEITNLVNDYKKGNNKYSILVWRIATLNYWLKHFT